ncbi:MAG: EAL domain-containing protein [Agarilytica sp.]
MKFLFKNSIGVMLLRFVFGCYLVVTIMVTASQLYFEYSNVEKEVITELYNVGRSFEDGLGSALWTLDANVINSILVGVQKIEAVAGVRVVNQDGVMEGGVGIFQEEVDGRRDIRTVVANGFSANEVGLSIQGEEQTFYEYELEIFYELEGSPKLQIGFAYIYVSRDTVIGRFKNSLVLILVNAVIKTSALWIIFLYFSRRFLSRPLDDLTKATAALSGDIAHSEEVSKRLETMSASSNQNELQQLASSFLVMRDTIMEEIDNLNTLNHFAVALTQSKEQSKIYERLFFQLSQSFDISAGAVFDHKHELVWSSSDGAGPSESIAILSKGINEYSLDIIRGHKEIVYKPKDTQDKNGLSSAGDLFSKTSLLYLPLDVSGTDKVEVWFLGDIKASRLNDDCQLSDDSHSFLQVMINLTSATLTSITQREIIEEQNSYLETRVLERTQELAAANKELRHMAVHDPLTHLPNRTLFHDRLHHMIDVASRDNTRFAVASIDLTEFKQINDSFGHDAGDTVLREIGERFSSVLRKSDTLARMGGDEFAAILASENIESSIEMVLTRLLASLQDAISTSDGESLLANANIGVAMFPEHGTEAEMLFKYADIAMYQAKRSGKGYAIFDKEKNSREKDYLQFMFELEHAIDKHQLRLDYQPIVDLKSGRPVSFEALLRWEHPERGVVPPAMFIPHAERTALIKPITFWVIREAAKQCARWQKDGMEASVSVNLSPRIFSAPELPRKLLKIVDEFGLDPKWLKLEITESAAMSNPKKALSIITKFNDEGFPISIDDFGTGHSSLSYLTRLPIDELKIDRSFLAEDDENSRIVVQTVIELSHSLKFYVVAEGIEDEETLAALREYGCDAVQGYHICRPNDAEAIEKWYGACSDNSQIFLPAPKSSS